MNGRLTLAAGLAIVWAAVAHVAAASSVTPISKIDWEQNQRVEFRWRDDAVPPGWMRDATLAAAADSNTTRHAKAAVIAYDADGTSWVAYTTNIDHPNALAYASRRVPDQFKVWFRPHGYVFDWGTLRWCQFYDVAPKGCFDAQMVALHEFGHVQGLGHAAPDAAIADTVMVPISPAKAAPGWNAHQFGPCDVASMQTRYELLTSATRVSDCLSLASTLTLGSSASIVTAGTTVTFTATLRIADDASQARLAGDPLSGRDVLLQRRQAGASSWSTHAQMAPATTAGTYRLSVNASATYEWRALFSQPDEGLLGDASAMLKVTVSDGCNPYCVE
jgi:hypothetical protein